MRGSQAGEMGLVPRRPEPRGRVEVEALTCRRCPVGEVFRERCEELQLRGAEDGAEAELAHRPGHAGREQRFGLLRGQSREPCPVAADQLAPAVASGLRVHRHACRAERFEVPVDRADRHLERLGQLGGGEPAPVLQEQQERDQTAGAHAPKTIWNP